MSTSDHNVFGQPITEALREKNRVFISHRMTDKEVAQEVAQYFEFLGLYYYFDEEDAVLRQVLSEGHSGDRAIVEAIDDGLTHSTHILAVLSERTMGSWWVPYEIGSGRSRGYGIAHLLLPSISSEMIPEYLRIYPQLWTARDLFEWAKELIPWPGTVVHRLYEEWFDVEGFGPFGELGPDEELVESWYAQAERGNSQYFERLEQAFRDKA